MGRLNLENSVPLQRIEEEWQKGFSPIEELLPELRPVELDRLGLTLRHRLAGKSRVVSDQHTPRWAAIAHPRSGRANQRAQPMA